MPKKINYQINLLPKDPFFETHLGRLLSWSLNVGRYIVIFTELIVILSFASRFILDRRITDLNESIYQKQIVVQSQSAFEDEFRLVQSKIQNYQQLEQQSNLVEVFPLLQKVIPSDLRLEKLTIRQQSVLGEGVALSNSGLNNFISNLQLSSHFNDIVVNKIESRDEKKAGFNIQFSCVFSL